MTFASSAIGRTRWASGPASLGTALNPNRSRDDLKDSVQLCGRLARYVLFVNKTSSSAQGSLSWAMATSMLATPRARPTSRVLSKCNVAARPARVPSSKCRQGYPPIAGPCRSKAVSATTAMYRRRSSCCTSWAAATPRSRSATNPGAARRRSGVKAESSRPAPNLLNELTAFLHRGVGDSPGHDRHRGSGIFRRALDQLVRVDHVDQHVALGVAAADDLHLLEEQRAALAEHVVALLQLVLESDRADLAAGERDVRDLLGKAEPALESALLRYGEMTGDALDLGVVEAIGRKLVVRAHPFEHGGAAEDQIGLVGSLGRHGGQSHGQEE